MFPCHQRDSKKTPAHHCTDECLGEKAINTYNREETFTKKYDARQKKFGTKEVMPLWVADMDLPTSHAIQEALSKRIEHPIFGYHHYHAKYLQSIKHWMLQQHTLEVAIKEISPINSIVSALMLAVETFSDKGEGILI